MWKRGNRSIKKAASQRKDGQEKADLLLQEKSEHLALAHPEKMV